MSLLLATGCGNGEINHVLHRPAVCESAGVSVELASGLGDASLNQYKVLRGQRSVLAEVGAETGLSRDLMARMELLHSGDDLIAKLFRRKFGTCHGVVPFCC